MNTEYLLVTPSIEYDSTINTSNGTETTHSTTNDLQMAKLLQENVKWKTLAKQYENAIIKVSPRKQLIP